MEWAAPGLVEVLSPSPTVEWALPIVFSSTSTSTLDFDYTYNYNYNSSTPSTKPSFRRKERRVRKDSSGLAMEPSQKNFADESELRARQKDSTTFLPVLLTGSTR